METLLLMPGKAWKIYCPLKKNCDKSRPSVTFSSCFVSCSSAPLLPSPGVSCLILYNYPPLFLCSLEALELFRPDFISRSQRRIRKLEQKTRERRSLQSTDEMGTDSTNRKQNCTKPHPLSDNLFKPKDRVISGKEMQLRSRRIYNKLPEVTKKKEEEKRRMVLQTNRLRAEVFKKVMNNKPIKRSAVFSRKTLLNYS
uniref:ALMS motif domain-containing protein n=1 Tax=Astyanax mexicanus TaxID=7994 RepID=A0A8B9KMS8_ASTMX